MGEVYRATDTKLGRDVAIKVLAPAFAEGSARMQRFEREAQVLASLSAAPTDCAELDTLDNTDSELVRCGEKVTPSPIAQDRGSSCSAKAA